MVSATKTPVTLRSGDPLRIGLETVSFGRNILAPSGATFVLQPRLVVNDPWELIAEAVHRAISVPRIRAIAHSFRRQAQDYFQAATISRETVVRPVLLYYAFLNLAKSYAVAKGNVKVTGKMQHGVRAVWHFQVSCSLRFNAIASAARGQTASFERTCHTFGQGFGQRSCQKPSRGVGLSWNLAFLFLRSSWR